MSIPTSMFSTASIATPVGTLAIIITELVRKSRCLFLPDVEWEYVILFEGVV